MRLGIAVLCLTASTARAEPSPLTHTSPVSPTGELVAPGHAEYIQGATIVHHDVAVGVADGLELRLGMPMMPLPLLGGDLQVRASVLPATSPWRVVIGAGVIAEWINGADAYPTASATVAWRGARWNVHATTRVAQHAGEDRERAALDVVGVAWRAGARTTVFAEVGRFALACTERGVIDGAIAGAWWQLPSVQLGVMGVIARHADHVLPIMPLLSIRHERDL